jgi:uncharacterized membrane protein YdjX (TVP38/TMEM64 family)
VIYFKNNLKNYKSAFLNILFFGAILSILFFSYKLIGSQNIKDVIRDSGIFGPIIYILFHSLTIIIAPLGGEVLFLSSGVLFGFWRGVLYSIISGYIGAIVNFGLARYFGKKIVLKLIGTKNSKN